MTVKISDYTALTSAASGDLLEIVDISDTTMAATGTNKKIVLSDLLASALPLAGGTMTGTITSTLGAITTSTPFLTGTVTWDANVNFESIVLDAITGSNFGTSSNLINLKRDGTTVFRVGGNDGSGSIYTLCTRLAHTGDEWQLSNFGLKVGKTVPVLWSSTDFIGGSADTGLYRNAAGVVEGNTGTAGTYAAFVAKEFRFAAPTSANGQYLAAKSLTELTTIAAAATTDTTIQLPANAIILGVSVRVTTAIPTATNFTVGDSGSAARFSTAAVSSAANSTDAGTKAGAYYNSTATSVRITPDATPGANTGRLRVTIHYLEMTPPTS
jgi:hypothetical protein